MGKCARRDAGRKEERERERENARLPGSPQTLISPGLFLGVTIKPLILLKLESKTCDWITEEDGGGRG